MNNKDAVIVICTRPDSKRLPNKAFKRIAGISALGHILRRLEHANLPIVLAAPFGTEAIFQPFAAFKNVRLFFGSPHSPLHRMAEAVELYGRLDGIPKYTIRVTHDDILIDVQTLNEVLKICLEGHVGYAITPSILEGAGVEVIHTANLFAAAADNTGPIEHISYFVKGETMPFPEVLHVKPRESVRRNYRLTLDYPEDAIVLESVLRQLGPFASNDDICQYLDQHPHVLRYNTLPEVSLYTCAYNAEKLVGQTMFSVQDSSMPVRAEYVIVEDSSTDKTLTEIMAYASYTTYKAGPALKVIVNESNIGLASSCNVALSNCRGRYVMRVDADDKLKPWAVEKMLSKAKETGAAIVYAGYDTFDESGKILSRDCDPKDYHHAGCALMDSRLINEIKFRDGLRHWDSLDLYKRVKAAKFPISYVQEPLWFYRSRPESMSRADENQAARKVLFKQINGDGPIEARA